MDISAPLGNIASQGVLGAFLVLSLSANVYMFSLIQKLNNMRVDDAKEITDKYTEPLNIIKQNSDRLIELFLKFLSVGSK